MAIFIWQTDAMEKMVQLEGESWRRHQVAMDFCSFDAFLQEFRASGVSPEIAAELSEKVRQACRQMSLIVKGNPSIYGFYGYPRYSVNYLGEIFFQAGFASPEAVVKAAALGFSIRGCVEGGI